MHAVGKNGYAEIVEILLQKGAHIDVQDTSVNAYAPIIQYLSSSPMSGIYVCSFISCCEFSSFIHMHTYIYASIHSHIYICLAARSFTQV
jgi:hypothetical protein